MKRANYRVPRDDETWLIIPDPTDLPALVRENRRLLASYDFQILGRPVQEFRAEARSNLLLIPYNCTLQSCLSSFSLDASRPLILTGHQPELYHPGVWLKNFLAGHLAHAVRGVSVNLNVDNDQPHQTAIRAPVRTAKGRAVRVEATYLQAPAGLAYEELSESMIGDRVPDELRRLGVVEELCQAADEYWRRIDAARVRCHYARTVTCARHVLEREVGLDNLEALVSNLARTDNYRAFVLDIICQAERFHQTYNQALDTFRQVHHEKNPAQPLPNLVSSGDRLELPFWVWRSGQPRRRLWLQTDATAGRSSAGDGCRSRLYIDEEDSPFVELGPDMPADQGRAAIAQLEQAEKQQGIKIRPRALSLTLFARVLLGDVFIHGVGGAIYDKVTDEIIRGYYGVEPPAAVMATGTLHLPGQTHPVGEEDRQRLIRRLRDIRCNADRIMPPELLNSPRVQELVARKRQIVSNKSADPAARRDAWHELHDINDALAAQLIDEPQATRRTIEDIRDKMTDNQILRDREYSFALYPRQSLLDFYARATRVPAEEVE